MSTLTKTLVALTLLLSTTAQANDLHTLTKTSLFGYRCIYLIEVGQATPMHIACTRFLERMKSFTPESEVKPGAEKSLLMIEHITIARRIKEYIVDAIEPDGVKIKCPTCAKPTKEEKPHAYRTRMDF